MPQISAQSILIKYFFPKDVEPFTQEDKSRKEPIPSGHCMGWIHAYRQVYEVCVTENRAAKVGRLEKGKAPLSF